MFKIIVFDLKDSSQSSFAITILQGPCCIELSDSFRLRFFLQEINSKFEGTFTALQGRAKVGLNHRDGKACGIA